jgi:hypothetical protein|tara:strand:- start:556 stop:1188 length:633 start_codon:yes stop_codon:yes gene_type:complete
MKQGNYHTEIDEVTYIREELEEIYNQHKHLVMNFGDYMETIQLKPRKREFKGRPGMNAINIQSTSKSWLDFPEIKKYVDMFDWEIYPQPDHIDMLHYDVGYKFHPHTDHFMNLAIMFPILPTTKMAPINFYSRPGSIPERNVNYEKKYGWNNRDIEYQHHYSLKHPTMFNGMAIHGVAETPEQRVILRVKCLGETYDSAVEKLKKGTFVK